MYDVVNYYWEISGKDFDPSKAESLAGVTFSVKYRAGEVVLGVVYDRGLGVLAERHPQYWPLFPEDALVSVIEKNIEIFRHCGAEEIVMHTTYAYPDQCNMEFRPEQLIRLENIGASMSISCYQVESDGEKEAFEE